MKNTISLLLVALISVSAHAADPAAGRDQKDSNHRRARGEDLLRRSTILPPDARVPGALWTATGPIAGRVGETEDGTPIEGLVTLYRSHETVEPVIVKFLRCCYFAVYGDPMPREPAPWVRSFTPELQSTLDQFLALPGVVTRGSFPFKFSIVRIGKYAHAWFELWEHLRYFASNQPVPSP